MEAEALQKERELQRLRNEQLTEGEEDIGFEEDIGYATDFFVSLPGVENNVFTAMSNLLISIPAGPIQPSSCRASLDNRPK